MHAFNDKLGDLYLIQWSVGATNAVLENFEYLVKAMNAFLQKSAQVHKMMCMPQNFHRHLALLQGLSPGNL